MSQRRIMRRIVLPQAVRIVMPAIGNEFIAMIKDTALVSVIGVQELLWRAQRGGSANFRSLETLILAAAMYWILTIIFSFFQERLESAHGPERPLMVALGEVVVEAVGIEKYFGTNHVLRGVDLEVRQHETVMLIGRSGSGKTTLLRCLNFLEEPTLGSVRIGDITVDADPLGSRRPRPRDRVRQPSSAGRHGLPGVQPLPAHDRARELHRGTHAA